MGTVEQNRKNGKKGGRPKGTKNPATLERAAVLKKYNQRVMGMADELLSHQLLAAKAQYKIYKITRKYPKVKNKKGNFVVDKSAGLIEYGPMLVINEKEIEKYLSGTFPTIEPNEAGVMYFPHMVKEPNAKVIDNILDRAFGKAVAPIAITDPEGNELDLEARDLGAAAIGAMFANKKKKNVGKTNKRNIK